MRFVSKWSYACAYRLAKTMNESHQKRSVYYYGFFIIIGELVKGVILISVSLLLGILLPALIIAFTFASLRVLAGGYHMDTYGKCLFVSLGLFIAAALIAQHTYAYWSLMYLMAIIGVTFLAGLYAVIRYVPRDTPNKPITDPQEIRKFKRLSTVYLFVWAAGAAALAGFGYNMVVLSLCFGVLLELFAVTPTGHRFFDRVKYRLAHKKKNQRKPHNSASI